MGYYIRVLSTSSACVPLSRLRGSLERGKLEASISVEDGNDDEWTQIVLSHVDGVEIASIERNLVENNSLGAEELAEFAEEISDCEPESAAKWLLEYFPRVRCIYAFQLLRGTDHGAGSNILAAIKNAIWSFAPAIIQADLEGFSNEDGYHILWQFSDSVAGTWWMGILRDGHWQHFQMDLGNRQQRKSFQEGLIPDGAKLA